LGLQQLLLFHLQLLDLDQSARDLLLFLSVLLLLHEAILEVHVLSALHDFKALLYR
jgi:hypothetical protein